MPNIEIKTFSDEARRILGSQDFVIFPLSGLTTEYILRSLKDNGISFNLPETLRRRIRNFAEIEQLQSMKSEVAFKPGADFSLFTPDTQRRCQEITKQLGRSDIEVIMGKVPDYLELISRYRDPTSSARWTLFDPTTKFERSIRDEINPAFSSGREVTAYTITATDAEVVMALGRLPASGETSGVFPMSIVVGHTPSSGIGFTTTDFYTRYRRGLTEIRFAPLVIPLG